MEVDETLNKECDEFIKNIKSHMNYRSEISSMLNNLEWLEKIEYAIPYIDNIMRNPRVTLITEGEVQEIEKAKLIGVDSIKDLAIHTNYIETVDEKTKDVKPSKILVLLKEETYNTYENRMVYTLIHDLSKFVLKKENQIKNINVEQDKKMIFVSKTDNTAEKINMELKITTEELDSNSNKENKLQKQINEVMKRLKTVRKLITIWQKSDMLKSLKKNHTPFVVPPLKKTNLTLKNPNYKEATKLFLYLRNLIDEENDKKDDYLLTGGNRTLIKLLDDTFLEDYFVLDSISYSKKAQKDLITKYALIMLTQQVSRIVEILLKNGVKVSDNELLKLINSNMGKKKSIESIGTAEVKKKFKKEIDEYLSKVKEEL